MVASATIIGSFAARMGMDVSDYARGILEAQGLNKVFGDSVATFIANPLLGSISILKQAGAAAISLGDRVLNTAEMVNQLAGETGIGTDFIQAFAASMVQATGTTEGAYAALRAYTKAIGEVQAGTRGGKLVEDALKAIGIDPRALREGEAGLRQIVDALLAVESRQARAAVASKIFGDQGAAIAVMFEGGARSAEEFIAKQVRLGQVLQSDTLVKLGAVSDRMDTIKAAINGIPMELMAEFLASLAGSDSGTQGIEDIADTVRRELIPAAREAGKEVREMIPALREVADLVQTIAANWKSIKNPFGFGNPHEIVPGGRNVPIIIDGEAYYEESPLQARPFAGSYRRAEGSP